MCDNKSGPYYLSPLNMRANPSYEKVMFRLFLIDKLIAGDASANGSDLPHLIAPAKRQRNRRFSDRFSVDNKHLALLNEQDILPIRDVSESGFSTVVAESTLARLHVGDVYRCRIRYMRDIYEIEARVAWKATECVGWAVLSDHSAVRLFFERIIKPVDIAGSLQPVTSPDFDGEHREWYQGIDHTNLLIWFSDVGHVSAWQLEMDHKYIEWDSANGITTGKSTWSEAAAGALANPWQPRHQADDALNEDTRQFATDLFMALEFSCRDQILETLMG